MSTDEKPCRLWDLYISYTASNRKRSTPDGLPISSESHGRVHEGTCHWGAWFNSSPLTKVAAIWQTTFSNAYSWVKSFVFWLVFHWSLFLRVKLTILWDLYIFHTASNRKRSTPDGLPSSSESHGRVHEGTCHWSAWFNSSPLTKVSAISQTTFSNAFSWVKSFVFWLIFHWSLFLSVKLTIFQHRLR